MDDQPNSLSSGQPTAAHVGSLCVVGSRRRLALTSHVSRQPEDWSDQPVTPLFGSNTTHRVPGKRDSFRRVNYRCIDTYFQSVFRATVYQASEAGVRGGTVGMSGSYYPCGQRAVLLAPGCQVIAD